MATVETFSNHEPVPATESRAEQGLTLATMAGGVGGAVAGTVLGAALGTAFPVLCGTLGTMLGGALFAGGWCLFERVRAGLFARNEKAHQHESAPEPAVAPMPGVECG